MAILKKDIPRKWVAKSGTFSKGIPAAESYNFSESGGANCSKNCEQLRTDKCYAINLEKHRSNIAVSGERKRVQGIVQTCMDYINELTRLNDNVIPWLRISSFGSVPATLTKTQAAVFEQFITQADRTSTNIHFPVETENKRSLYQGIVDKSGSDACVRLSLQKPELFEKLYEKQIPISMVFKKGKTLEERIVNAHDFAQYHERVVVCPSIQTKANKSKAAKCGNCTACADKTKVIIYPEH